MSDADRERVREILQSLRDSCQEALQEIWIPSGEGMDGFDAMIGHIEEAAELLNLPIERRTFDGPFDDEEEEDEE